MSLLSKLFGKSEPQAPVLEVYKDFRIFPEPIKDGTQFRISARIEKTVEDGVKSHHMIRADTVGSAEKADDASVAKVKVLIDKLSLIHVNLTEILFFRPFEAVV